MNISWLRTAGLDAEVWVRRGRGRRADFEVTDSDRQEAARRAKAYRKSWCLTQEDLAVEMNCSPQMISMAERGSQFASTRVTAALAVMDMDLGPVRLSPERLAKVLRVRAVRQREHNRPGRVPRETRRVAPLATPEGEIEIPLPDIKD